MVRSSPKLLYFVALDSYFCSHRLPHAIAAKKAGYDVHLATVVTSHLKEIESTGVTVWPLHHLKRGQASILQDLKSLWEVYQLFRRLKPDIIHDVAMKPVLFGAIAGKFVKVKKHIHALGGLGYLFVAKTLKAKIMRTLILILWRVFLRGRNKIMIVQNQDDYDVFLKNRILSKENLVLIPGSGVDLEHFAPGKPENKVPVIVCGARMLWDKGIGELIEAARLLKNEGVQFKLQLCGASDSENPTAIPIEILQAWQEEGVVEWLGHVVDMAAVYKKADIATLPSYREGIPKSLLEAAACGLPIVTTDVPGCRDVIIDQKNGLLVPAREINSLAEALKVYIKNAEKRHHDGMEGRRIAREKFSLDKIIQLTLELYKVDVARKHS